MILVVSVASLLLLPVAVIVTVTMEYAYCYGQYYCDPNHPAPGTVSLLSLSPQAPPLSKTDAPKRQRLQCCDAGWAAENLILV